MVKDTLFGGVRLSGFEAALLDLPLVQRLRKIRQLALAYLVYPGANHSRFEHSVGAMELAGRICTQLEFGEEDTAKIRAAALLHDVGHPVFSHELEELAVRFGGSMHEEMGAERIESSEIAEVIGENGFSPKEIAGLALGRGKGAVVCGELGSDRMDYLLRDAYYTGVAFGVIDSGRLVECFGWKKGSLVLGEGGLAAAESLLVARFLMFNAVYSHHTVRIASAMLCRAAESALESGEVEIESLYSLGDGEFFSLLKNSPESSELAFALEERRLFKRAFEAPWLELGGSGLAKRLGKRNGVKALEGEIASKAGVDASSVLVDSPFKAWGKPVEVKIEHEGRVNSLVSVSDLVASLKKSEEKRAKLLVACPKKDLARVKSACRKILD